MKVSWVLRHPRQRVNAIPTQLTLWRRTVVNAIKPPTSGYLSSALSVVREAREMKSTRDKIKADNLAMGELVETNKLVRVLEDNVQARIHQLQQKIPLSENY